MRTVEVTAMFGKDWRIGQLFSAAIALLLLSACTSDASRQAPAPATQTVTAVVEASKPMALPTDSVLIIRLVDLSEPDESRRIVAFRRVYPVRALPVSVEVPYQDSSIRNGHLYAFSAKIFDPNVLILTTDDKHAAPLTGIAGEAKVAVIPAS
jgi:uncharacterized lipoprotein YbaY